MSFLPLCLFNARGKKRNVIWILAILYSSSNFIYAQSANVPSSKNDPLHNPEVWDLLIKNSEDSVMWSNYINKPWKGMTEEEKNNISEWKYYIKQAKPTKTTKLKELPRWPEESTFISQKRREEMKREQEKRQYVNNLRSMMTAESQELARLKKNIPNNFILIDTRYKDEFEGLGQEYVSYHTKYPEENYDFYKWVKEQEIRLKELKMQRFNKMITTMFKQNTN